MDFYLVTEITIAQLIAETESGPDSDFEFCVGSNIVTGVREIPIMKMPVALKLTDMVMFV